MFGRDAGESMSKISTIYRPKGRALEYSFLAVNHYVGCEHGCRYCYAEKMANQFNQNFTRPELRNGRRFIEQLSIDAAKFANTKERVLLSFMSDPYQPIDDDIRATREVIKILRRNNIPFQILTKGGTRAVRDFDMYGPDDAFATTLTCSNLVDSEKHEPHAAFPTDRIEAIRIAHAQGIRTWVSLEPVIYPAQSLGLIGQTYGFVDLFKIGKMNHVKNDIDWRKFALDAIELCERVGVDYYIKHDLAKYIARDVEMRGQFYKSVEFRTVK